jgi:hypothetical protein
MGCARNMGNITRRASGLTSLRCLGTRTTEESVQKVLQMAVASCHWCYLPREGIDFCLDVCFINSSPVELPYACTVEGDRRHVQNVGAGG